MSALKVIVCMKNLYEYERQGKVPSIVPDMTKEAERLFIEAEKMYDAHSEMDPMDLYPEGVILQIVKPTGPTYSEDENVLASYMDQIAAILGLMMYGKYETLYDNLSMIKIMDVNNLIVRGYLDIVTCDIVAAETETMSLGSQGLISCAMLEDRHGIVSIPDVKMYEHPIPEMTVKYVTKLLSTFL